MSNASLAAEPLVGKQPSSVSTQGRRPTQPLPKGPLTHKAGISVGLPTIYAGVVAATFGGVKIRWDSDSESLVHPIFLLIFCWPVFMLQLTTIAALRTDLDIDTPVYEPGNPISEHLLSLKLVMVAVVYLMNFKILLESVHHLAFLLNPMTWAEVQHPASKEWFGAATMDSLIGKKAMWCFNALGTSLAGLFAFVAVLMNLSINYAVCTDSISVILSGADAKDAIFDALAITFVVDLGRYFWDCVAYVFNLSDLSEFTFRVYDEQSLWDKNGQLVTSEITEHFSPMFKAVVNRLLSYPWARHLRLGHGARRISHGFSVFVLAWCCYLRQFIVVLHSVDSGVLPVARDVCSLHRLQHSEWPVSRFVNRVLNHFMILNQTVDIERLIKGSSEFAERCPMILHNQTKLEVPEDHYMRLEPGDWRRLPYEYPVATIVFSLVLLIFLVLPALTHCLHGGRPTGTGGAADTADLPKPAQKDEDVEADNGDLEQDNYVEDADLTRMLRELQRKRQLQMDELSKQNNVIEALETKVSSALEELKRAKATS